MTYYIFDYVEDSLMKNPGAYNRFIESLELQGQGGLLYHRIDHFIYITNAQHKLLGVWNLETGEPAEVHQIN